MRLQRACFCLSLPTTGRHSKEVLIYEPGRAPSPEMESAGAVISDFPALRKTVRNKFVLFKLPRNYGVFVLAAQTKVLFFNIKKKKLFIHTSVLAFSVHLCYRSLTPEDWTTGLPVIPLPSSLWLCLVRHRWEAAGKRFDCPPPLGPGASGTGCIFPQSSCVSYPASVCDSSSLTPTASALASPWGTQAL